MRQDLHGQRQKERPPSRRQWYEFIHFSNRVFRRAFFVPGISHALCKSEGFKDKDSNPKTYCFLATLRVGISYNIIKQAEWRPTDWTEQMPCLTGTNSAQMLAIIAMWPSQV